MISFRERIDLAAKWIKNSKYLIAFTGAGISTESGLPDYRGIWRSETNKITLYNALSVNWKNTKPNDAHMALVKLQELNLLKFLISQNIDNLHLTSGIHDELIAELHGNITLARCQQCGKKYAKTWDRPSKCFCGGSIKSSIIKFDEELPKEELNKSFNHTKLADVFLMVGSSLLTQPAGRIPRIAKKNGARLIFVNRGETALDRLADLRFNENASKVLNEIIKKIVKKEKSQ
ncbi:MAG TPA: hypothetical protein ENH75_06375 [archaeon]|nr:hypothetical protein [archaeon]